MAGAWPASLKPIAKYVARGNEVEATHPVVAFYCNLYAVKEGFRRNTGDGEAFLLSLLEKTEALKKIIGQDDDKHHREVEEYALSRFAEADDDDMAGIATPATAKKYFLASCYLDVCNVFKQSEEVATKGRFAKSRTVAIQKAIREGSDPRRPELINPPQQEETPPQDDEFPPAYPSAPPSAPPSEHSFAPPSEHSFAPPSEHSFAPPSAPPSAPPPDFAPQPMYPPGPPTPPAPSAPSADKASDAFARLNFLSASAFPEIAPQYQSFVDPTGGLSFRGAPPSKPLPSIPSGPDVKSFGSIQSVSSSAPSAPYVRSPQPERAPVRVASRAATTSNVKPSIEMVKTAQSNAKHAISALDFEDYAGAVLFLEQALAALRGS